MSFLTKSLDKRIKELRASIEAQKVELAAYEQVLALEKGKPMQSATEAQPPSSPSQTPEFNGSRSNFVLAALKERGSEGITPKEISDAFAARNISVGKNLVYNVLSTLFKQKRVRKAGGRYYLKKS